jgi:hypothetical protein
LLDISALHDRDDYAPIKTISKRLDERSDRDKPHGLGTWAGVELKYARSGDGNHYRLAGRIRRVEFLVLLT